MTHDVPESFHTFRSPRCIQRIYNSHPLNDENKRAANFQKHGIDFPIAATALNEQRLESQSDRNGEVRTLAICPSSGNLIAIVYTMRDVTCRIISARPTHRHERRKYRQIFAG
ncbi:BrnT family toxin [Rhizobium sp. Root482]|uniref:BrnT family toxin n=1 Tax=Rhizobium sp. Root482 TaxID=1736543 RepID=UPI002A4E220F|nr:BrnT family toxin [Rhizobium sp. Root482]